MAGCLANIPSRNVLGKPALDGASGQEFGNHGQAMLDMRDLQCPHPDAWSSRVRVHSEPFRVEACR